MNNTNGSNNRLNNNAASIRRLSSTSITQIPTSYPPPPPPPPVSIHGSREDILTEIMGPKTVNGQTFYGNDDEVDFDEDQMIGSNSSLNFQRHDSAISRHNRRGRGGSFNRGGHFGRASFQNNSQERIYPMDNMRRMENRGYGDRQQVQVGGYEGSPNYPPMQRQRYVLHNNGNQQFMDRSEVFQGRTVPQEHHFMPPPHPPAAQETYGHSYPATDNYRQNNQHPPHHGSFGQYQHQQRFHRQPNHFHYNAHEQEVAAFRYDNRPFNASRNQNPRHFEGNDERVKEWKSNNRIQNVVHQPSAPQDNQATVKTKPDQQISRYPVGASLNSEKSRPEEEQSAGLAGKITVRNEIGNAKKAENASNSDSQSEDNGNKANNDANIQLGPLKKRKFQPIVFDLEKADGKNAQTSDLDDSTIKNSTEGNGKVEDLSNAKEAISNNSKSRQFSKIPARYFIARCNYYDMFAKTRREAIWRAPEYIVERIRRAVGTCDRIVLFFSVHGTQYFQGMAQVDLSKGISHNFINSNNNDIGGPIPSSSSATLDRLMRVPLKWICFADVPYYAIAPHVSGLIDRQGDLRESFEVFTEPAEKVLAQFERYKLPNDLLANTQD